MKPGSNHSNGKKSTATKSSPSPASKKASSSSGKKESSGLRELFVDQLKDIYWAEKALTKAIPKMIRQACHDELISALETHLEETVDQVTRCEKVFSLLNLKPQAKTCEAMKGLIEEATEIMSSMEEGSTRDAGIICAAQKVEHYEMATYGCLVAFARKLGETKAAAVLESILEEEKNADATLTEVAESAINEEATSEMEMQK
jgi:ferritin-like metal-binding protein YciE